MDCPVPRCGGATKVTMTIKKPKSIMRRRKCLNCGTCFVTKEHNIRITTKNTADSHGKNSPHAQS